MLPVQAELGVLDVQVHESRTSSTGQQRHEGGEPTGPAVHERHEDEHGTERHENGQVAEPADHQLGPDRDDRVERLDNKHVFLPTRGVHQSVD